MPQTFYDVLWIFMVYAFLGWCTEVAYAATEKGIFINRGFLNGPYCPIYGCGVLIVVAVLTPLKDNLLILFAGSFLLTSTLEFLTGFLLEKIFKNKWWDYSDKPFNIKGYVCLKFSILWGLACSFIMLVLHPIIYRFIKVIPYILGVVILIAFLVVFAVDLFVTISTINKFNKRMKLLNEISADLKVISNEIGENVYENVMEALEIKEKIRQSQKEFNEKHKREQEELMAKYRELFEYRNAVSSRLMRAFPNMKSIEHNEILQKLKKKDLEWK
ncbi:MAG: putative ABC transporter permease [Roseburia sp.]|nr:putative ABC transporter permease [Roseburia sp.]